MSTIQLPASGISHGWIRPVVHPEFGVEVNGQSVVRYLRFRRQVQVDHLELTPTLAGRWIPSVPTHPAHVVVSTRDAGQWRVIADVELPYEPRIAGEDLQQGMSIAEMDGLLQAGFSTVHRIELDGVTTDLLRVECDREHPVWPNHGECNGTPFAVPFAMLNTLTAFGETLAEEVPLPIYQPPLCIGIMHPVAPVGMTVEHHPWGVFFRGERFTVGFSLRRPELLHLGWDGTDSGRAAENRLYLRACTQPAFTVTQNGPVLRTVDGDFSANCWTGRVEIDGNRVCYRELDCGQGVRLEAIFSISADGMTLELCQHAERDIPVLEAEAWRLGWDCTAAMTAAAAMPTLRPGRNGEVETPCNWAGDGNGCLCCMRLDGESYLQIESYRERQGLVGGIVLGSRPQLDDVPHVPAGTHSATWQWTVDAFAPAIAPSADPGAAIRRHWGSIYSCFRPEFGGFSNNALSVNCHVNQHAPMEIVAYTRLPACGPDPLALYRFTIERALLGGGGYGFWRNLYLDSDPMLVSGVGLLHQAQPDTAWLAHVAPGVQAATRRMLGTLGPEGLAICRDLSGDSGSFRWSSNAMDVVGFGHMDAYVNAWTYRALRNATVLLREIDPALAAQSGEAAVCLRDSYPRYLLNPDTGWVAGWRSRDGQLHDAAYLWVNGCACAFGLLSHAQAVTALQGLERLRHEVGAGGAHFGLPFNLHPIPASDHMLPRIFGRLSPTFEIYTDGAMSPASIGYYLRALDSYGLHDAAAQIAADLEVGYLNGHFNGGLGSGVEFHRWDGVPTGYEGTFVLSWAPLYAIAVQRGLLQPFASEWWPA